jgi:predicted nucleic acid-binding protein
VILVDTSVWIDHFRRRDAGLVALLERSYVVMHPFVIGELALGTLRQRDVVIEALRDLPRVRMAGDDEVLLFIDRHDLAGKGIGYVDAHLLAAARLTPGTLVWTRDRRLHDTAGQLAYRAA